MAAALGTPMDVAQRNTRLRQMAALCRVANKHTAEDIAELHDALDRIAAQKEKEARVFSPRAFIPCSKQAARTYGEFVCNLEGSERKGNGEVFMLTRASDLGEISRFLQEAFHLRAGSVLITLPEDPLFDEMEQLVLSTKHLSSLLDDFVLRQPTRRVVKVLKATLPITRCLAINNRSRDCDAEEGTTTLALNRLLELVQVPANVETVDQAGRLSELLVAVGFVIGRSLSPIDVAVACRVVWKLAALDGMRSCLSDHGLLDELWALAENIARNVETPEGRRKRQKATEAAASTGTYLGDATGKRERSLQGITAGAEAFNSKSEIEAGEPLVLQKGLDLDEIATNCLGAISLMLRSREVVDSIVQCKHHNRLEILFELATAPLGRGGIGDERVPCLAAEALAHVLISHGTCRVAWAERGLFLPLLDLMSSSLDRVVLCGTSILNAFLRGEPAQVTVTPAEAVEVIKKASLACQRCLDRLGFTAPPEKPRSEQGSHGRAGAVAPKNMRLPLHGSMDADTLECLSILEQATATCWGSLATIHRCPSGPAVQEIPLACWFPTMLAVAKLSGTKWISPWVIFCAVACVGLGVGAGANPCAKNMAEMEALPGEMLSLLKRTNSLELQEHAARTLCTLLSANIELRLNALRDGFLDKIQRLLVGCLGSPKLDSTLACCIMFLCDVCCDRGNDGKEAASDDVGSAESAELARAEEGNSCATRKKRFKGENGTQTTGGIDWGVWSQKQLASVVWALGHSNQDVLTYTAWTVWLLARRPENRLSLGRLWAIDGLVHGLRSNARLDVKQGLLAATWLLACDAENTARLAMNGGLQILVGILKFSCSACYVPLKSLAVGILCAMCRAEPDVATLAMHLSLAPALLQAVHDSTSTVYLKVLSAGLIFTLCRNGEHQENHSDNVKQFAAEGYTIPHWKRQNVGHISLRVQLLVPLSETFGSIAARGVFILEDMCAGFLASSTSELQACGSFMAASLALGAGSRNRLHDNGGLEALCRLVRAPNTKKPLKTRSLHALLNLSTETGWVLQALVEMTGLGTPPQSEFASSILSNCAKNPCCRAIMFEGQLARGSNDVAKFRSDLDLEKTIRASRWAHHVAHGGAAKSRAVREQFLSWVKEVKEGGSNAQAANNSVKNQCAGKPETVMAEPDGSSPMLAQSGITSAGSIRPKTKVSLRKREEATMLRVWQDMRQPVTSLWQTAAERTLTAPSRTTSYVGGIPTGANPTARHDLSGRRPRSQLSSARATRGNTRRSGNESAGAGESRLSAGVSADGNTRGISPGRLSREYGPANTQGLAAPARGPGGLGLDSDHQGRRTPIPLRSSHRVGPVGSLGSTPLPAGEYRWKPFVCDCYTKPNPLPAWRRRRNETPPDKLGVTASGTKGLAVMSQEKPSRPGACPGLSQEERDIMFSQAVKENQTVVVVEPPLRYKLVFNGPTNAGVAKPRVNPISMALFPHVHGASVCAPLYDHYVAEDGLCYHLYHTSRITCEVLDPGGYPYLSEPTELRHVLQKALPEAPPPDYPSGRPDAKPVLYLPAPRQCPPITTHFITLCKVACRQVHGDEACPGVRCKMFGAFPSDFMVFEVSEQPHVEEDEDQTATASDLDTSKWDVNHSIYAPRRKAAESRTFWDTDRVVRKALDADFSRMLKEDRILKLVAKSDAAVVNEQKTVSESLEEVKKAIAPFYKTILSIFKYYCLTPSQSVRGAFSIQPNQFGKMMQDADLAGNSISVEEIGKIFVMVNFETDKHSAEASVNEDRALMRFELLEALLRVAITIRDNEGNGEVSPADKLRSVIKEKLLANLPREATEDSDTFRNEFLYSKACDTVFQDHQKALSVAYQKYSMLDPVGGKPSFGLEEWKTFTNDARLVGDSIHMLRMGLRDIKQPFYLARMVVSDEIKSRTKMTQLTFVDFLEALARLAAAIPIPSDEHMRHLKVVDIMDYEAALSFSMETSSAQHDIVAGSTEGALAPRLDRLIRFILGNLAIRSNGVLKAANKGMNLVGLYCTKEHLARGIFPP